MWATNGQEGLKIFIDDMRPVPDGWHLATTNTEAIRILDTQVVSAVSIDHDISHDVKVGSVHRPYPCGETFEPTARFLAQMLREREARYFADKTKGRATIYKFPITIHTANAVGAKAIHALFGGLEFVDVVIKLGAPCTREVK